MVTKQTLIVDIERHIPQSDAIFMRYGLGHLGTLMAFFDTVGESAQAHGVDPDLIVDAINGLESARYVS